MTVNIFDKYSMRTVPRAPDDGAGSGGAAAGGAAAGAGAAASAGAAAGAAAGGGAAAAAGAATGGAAAAGGAADQGWWRAPDHGFDADTVKFLDGKNPPDMKVALASWRSADEMARSRNVIGKPDPKNPAGWEGYNDLGWLPDKAKYAEQIKPPQLAQGEEHDAKAFAAFTDYAHEMKLAPWQAEKLYSSMHKSGNQALADFKAAGAAANRELDTKLRTQWTSNYDANVELAKRAFGHFKVDGITGAQMDQIMGAPQMVELFYNIGAAMGEDKLVTTHNTGGQTPAGARAERLRLENDPKWMAIFNNPRHPQYQDYVGQRQRLIDAEAKR